MYKHLLIATDGSEQAGQAVRQGVALAEALNAKITAVTVSDPPSASSISTSPRDYTDDAYEANATLEARIILSGVADAAAKVGVPCETLHVRNHDPAKGIVDAAEARDCDLIVMASHGRRGLSRLMLGSQTSRAVTLSSIPVLVCR
jgi:nucleotide-binding universal stress UspA family protein